MASNAAIAVLLATVWFPELTVGTEQSVRDHYLSNGGDSLPWTGSIMRMELDVTGDGRKEVFLSNSELTGSSGGRWLVYSPMADSSYRVFARISFHGRFFRYERDTSLFVAGGHVSAEQTSLRYYRVDVVGFTLLKGGICPGFSADCEHELDLIRAWQKSDAPPLYFLEVEKFSDTSFNRWHTIDEDVPVELTPLDKMRVTPEQK